MAKALYSEIVMLSSADSVTGASGRGAGSEGCGFCRAVVGGLARVGACFCVGVFFGVDVFGCTGAFAKGFSASSSLSLLTIAGGTVVTILGASFAIGLGLGIGLVVLVDFFAVVRLAVLFSVSRGFTVACGLSEDHRSCASIGVLVAACFGVSKVARSVA